MADNIKRLPSGIQKQEEQKGETPAAIPPSPAGVPLASAMTNEYITGKLFSFHNTAHYYHFQCSSHAQHKALEHLYERLVHLKDEIPEFLLGLQAPMRLQYIVLDEIKPFSDTALLSFLEEGCAFGKSLCECAELRGLEPLEDMAGHICKEFSHCKLLISYK